MVRSDKTNLIEWIRFIALIGLLGLAGFAFLKIASVFWKEWALGKHHWEEASRTVDKCAATGVYDTRHFRVSCETAAIDMTKYPLIFAIEKTWEQLWPCRDALCTDLLLYLTRSLWTIFGLSLIISVGLLWLIGWGTAPAHSVMFSPTYHTPWSQQPKFSDRPHTCIVDVNQLNSHDD